MALEHRVGVLVIVVLPKKTPMLRACSGDADIAWRWGLTDFRFPTAGTLRNYKKQQAISESELPPFVSTCLLPPFPVTVANVGIVVIVVVVVVIVDMSLVRLKSYEIFGPSRVFTHCLKTSC